MPNWLPAAESNLISENYDFLGAACGAAHYPNDRRIRISTRLGSSVRIAVVVF